MSRQSSRDRTSTLLEPSEVLDAISEEIAFPTNASKAELDAGDASKTGASDSKPAGCPASCACKVEGGVKFSPQEVEAMLLEKEDKLKTEFARRLEADVNVLKEKFDLILQNEQIRASYMLREAHRERQEKVQALQTQLECKNMAGLMYVLCSERKKCKLEKLKMVEDYTNYIHTLQDILSEGQRLILYLSRGYKTAARVDHEWREKMRKVIKEFQEYVYHFAGGSPDTNQYVFDIPALLKTEAAIVNDSDEDPCTCEDEEELEGQEPEVEKNWWEQLDGEGRPFAVFGDMASFSPPQRREVLRAVKGAKTAPAKWKEYVFNEMLLHSGCPNADAIKDLYPERIMTEKWECHALPEQDSDTSRVSSSRRCTTTSVDMKAAMGSMLRVITTSNMAQSTQKANILAARDSMEIASTTRLEACSHFIRAQCIPPSVFQREKTRESYHGSKCVSISIGSHKPSASRYLDDDLSADSDMMRTAMENISKIEEEEHARRGLGTAHNDSLHVIPGHVPEKDRRINYEKICPMDKCQRMQVDSFTRSLPSYMRASPFTHFQHTFDDYETCSKEQLEILRHRLAEKASRSRSHHQMVEDPLDEWTPEVEGVGVQTSDLSLTGIPPCSCILPAPSPSLVSSVGKIFNVEDLIPMKEALDTITKECFHDDRIIFDRFKVIGQEESATSYHAIPGQQDFKQVRVAEISKILKQHPSLLDLFQGNTQC